MVYTLQGHKLRFLRIRCFKFFLCWRFDAGGLRQIKGLFLLPPTSSEAILQPSSHGGKARTGRWKIVNHIELGSIDVITLDA